MKTIYVTSPLVWRRRLVEILPSIPVVECTPVSEVILRLRGELCEGRPKKASRVIQGRRLSEGGR